ncbi:MAG: DUF3054 domain-containing protein [Ktedonobacteraceae bacterium]|nr:DUF3054 domain-containing protein [Ktedonobacteraceae bacterium]
MKIKNTDNLTLPAGEQPDDKKSMSTVRRLSTLIVGDVLVFLIFSMVGRSSHGEAAGLDAFGQIVQTAAPFAIGWFLIAPFLGAYRRGLEVEPGRMARRTLLAWLCSWPLGMLLRCIAEQRIPNYTFFIVSFLSIAVILLIWRWPFALTNSIRYRQNQTTA